MQFKKEKAYLEMKTINLLRMDVLMMIAAPLLLLHHPEHLDHPTYNDLHISLQIIDHYLVFVQCIPVDKIKYKYN